MTKRKGYVAWPIWPFLVILGIMIVSAFLALPSVLFPYMASASYKWFCYFVLAPTTFAILFASLLCAAYVNRHIEAIKRISVGSTFIRCAVGSALLSALWALLFMVIIPAIPSKYFAEKKVSMLVTVDHLDGFRLDHDYYTWIYFDRGDVTGRFMWTRSDPIMKNLKQGDCIIAHARAWPLGIYVDSIARSRACQDKGAFGVVAAGDVQG